MSHDARFSIIPGWIVTDPRLKGRDLQVLCLLGRHTDKHGWCRRSQVKMAAQLNCARSTVQLSLDRLSEMGVVEKHEEVSVDGRDSAHSYRVIYDRAPPSGFSLDGADDADSEENDPISAPTEGTPPADISAPPADPGSAPPADPGSAPPNDPYLTTPDKRGERARDRDDDQEENPREVERRFRRWWPTWPSYAVDDEAKTRRAWLALTPEQRRECEEKTPDYLEAAKSSGRSYSKASSTYLNERAWERIAAVTSAKAVAAAAPVARDGRIVVPVFGPAYGAARAWAVMDGPVHFELPADLRQRVQATYEAHARRSFQAALAYLQKLSLGERDGVLIFPEDFEAQERARRTISEGYPEANRLHDAARERKHVTVWQVFERLKDLCEAVPVGSAMWDRWRDYHDDQNLPFCPTPHHQRVVYFPKGGPEGLEVFERAARSLIAAREDDDAQ